MQHEISALCSLCFSIDFSVLVWPTLHDQEKTSEKIDLGDAQDLRARAASCDLCQLIVSRLDLVNDPDIEKNAHDRCWLGTTAFNPAQSSTEATCSGKAFQVCWLYIEVAPATFKGFVGPLLPDRFYKPGVQNPSSTDATVQSRPWTLMHLQGCIDPIPHVDTCCQSDGSFPRSLWKGRYSGRMRDPIINLHLPRCWLKLCRERHKNDCSPVPRPSVKDMRVIDVQDMAIVRAPEGCQYVALSYCWGSSSTVLLKRENIVKFSQVRALDGVVLPNTITDAVLVTRGLGERYLWVDALCIVQDDTALLLQQIPQMAHIYEHSVCTIIAASARNSDEGLAGVRPGTRALDITTIRLSGMNLITAAEDPRLDGSSSRVRRLKLEDYKWRTRAWTLQEEVVSRRKIFFESDRIFWCCSHGILTEETEKEVTTSRRSIMGYRSSSSASTFLEIDVMSENIMDMDFTPAIYEGIVRRYSERQLSFPSDSINAITGILAQSSEKHAIRFIWGHPEPWFISSLLWTTNYKCQPNLGVQKMTLSDDTEFEVPIPSWSWAAWVGKLYGDRIFYRYDLGSESSKAGDWCPLLYRCVTSTSGKSMPYVCINPGDFQEPRNWPHHKWIGTPQHIGLTTTHPNRGDADSALLQTWTSVAIAYIGERPTKLRRETTNHVLLDQHAAVLDDRCFIQSLETLLWADEARYDHYPAAMAALKDTFEHGLHEIYALALELRDGWVQILIAERVGDVYHRRGICSTQESRWSKTGALWSLITLG